MCSIFSDLITSTMKSELGLPARCGISFGTRVSFAISATPGGRAPGSRFTSAADDPGVAALATLVDAAAPATAAPARNLRRLTSGSERLRAMSFLQNAALRRKLGQDFSRDAMRTPCRHGACQCRMISHGIKGGVRSCGTDWGKATRDG